MGLIKAASKAVSSALAGQWKEFIYCDALPADVLAVKGKKRISNNSANTKGIENVISDGSTVAIATGQCMLIVEQGKVVDVCAEPGEYVYDTGTEPSIFTSGLSEGVLDTFKSIGKYFTYGGEVPKDQRVYYINTKELVGNKYGTPNPVPFRVVDSNIGLDIDVSIRCFGKFSYKITNPLLFYTNLCGNIEEPYTRDEIDGQLKTELITALQPAFAKISAMGVRYSALPGYTAEIVEALNSVLCAKWRDLRGIELVSLGISSVKASDENENMIKELQRSAVFRNPNMAAAHLASAQASAIQSAAANGEAGAAMAFLGMNMAGQAGFANVQSLFQMGQQAVPQPQAAEWACTCGHTGNTGKFCSECGSKKPF